MTPDDVREQQLLVVMQYTADTATSLHSQMADTHVLVQVGFGILFCCIMLVIVPTLLNAFKKRAA